jgi:hypothetical protein
MPRKFQTKSQSYTIPQTLDEFTNSLCYGQRIFLGVKENEDISIILRQIDGYYYPIVTGLPWDEKKSLNFGKLVLTCNIIDLYPIAMHLINLVSEMAQRETRLLRREPSKIEKLAGIDKLNLYSELAALDFLRTSMDKTMEQVMLTPYNECLVRFMMAKETIAYQERLFERQKDDQLSKIKRK